MRNPIDYFWEHESVHDVARFCELTGFRLVILNEHEYRLVKEDK